MRASVRRVIAAIVCIAAAITAVGLVTLGGTEQGTGDQARAQGAGPEPPGPFPDVYPPGDTYTVPGERDGESTFPVARYRQLMPKQPGVMDFQHYHSEAEINWWLSKWAYEHPDIVELNQVGTTFGGKPMYQITVTNKALGDADDKPAAYFDGGRHSGEITATEAVLYQAWKLITQYGKDRDITQMVNDKAIYLRPLANPDGGELYRQTAQTNRSSIRPTDNNGNGLLDDESPKDLNGDGYITQIRRNVGAGNGNYIVDGRDPTGRTMRRVPDGEGNYILQSESGGSDAIGGLDLHRNYPYNWRPMPGQDATGRGWTQGGAGEYPLSEPEIRSTYDFLIRHPNIGVVNSMDTAADMILRGPSTCDDEECVKPADIKLLEHFDRVGQQLARTRARATFTRTTRCSPRARARDRPAAGRARAAVRPWPGLRVLPVRRGLVRRRAVDLRRPREGLQRRRAVRRLGGSALVHRKRGAGLLPAVGGVRPPHARQGRDRRHEPEVLQPEPARRNARAVRDRRGRLQHVPVQSLPNVNIVRTNLVPTGGTDGATHELRVTVENQGRIPTALEQAKEVKIVRPDTVEVELPEGTGEVVGDAPEFYLAGNQRRTVSVRLKLTQPQGRYTLRLESTRGGVDERSLLFD